MTKDNLHYQVIIVGGGPAGVATALTLSARGITNCIIEALPAPLNKCGEAIPPNANPILKRLGILHLVSDPKHAVYYGNKSSWGSNELEQKEFIQEIHGHGYLLDRIYFEIQLQDWFRKNQGIFYSGHKVKTVRQTTHGVIIKAQNKQESIFIEGKYVVDATGRKASICRKLGVSKKEIDSQYALAVNVNISQPVQQEILVEAVENGWWYSAPKSQTELTVMFFTLKELIPPKKDLGTFLTKELEKTRYVSQFIDLRKSDFENIQIRPTGTNCLDIPYGDRWIAVGDAAYSYDPVSSFGITSALASGFYAGQALASTISGEKDAMSVYRYIVENAFQAYLKKLLNHYSIEKRWENSFYWKNRF